MKVLITGASRGLGLSLVKKYVKQNAAVVGVARTSIKKEGVQFYTADLSNLELWPAFFDYLKKQGPFDLCIHNLAINRAGMFNHCSEHDQNLMIDVNFTFPTRLTQFLMQENLLSKGAVVVFINTIGHFTSYPGSALYVATKSALSSFARSLRPRFTDQGIHVLEVFPGPMETDMARENSPRHQNTKRRSPDQVAEGIITAIGKKRRVLVPGLAMKLLYCGTLFLPRVFEKIMVKTIYEPMARLGKVEAKDNFD